MTLEKTQIVASIVYQVGSILVGLLTLLSAFLMLAIPFIVNSRDQTLVTLNVNNTVTIDRPAQESLVTFCTGLITFIIGVLLPSPAQVANKVSKNQQKYKEAAELKIHTETIRKIAKNAASKPVLVEE